MWAKAKMVLKGKWQDILIAILGVGLMSTLVGLCVYASHQPNTFVVQTKNGPVTKTYYGSLDSVTAQEKRDEAIAGAEMQGKSPKEALAIGQSEYEACMQPSDFHILEALIVLPFIALLLPFAFLSDTRKRRS